MKVTNMEKYRSKIEKNEYSIAMANGKLAKCHETNCSDCDFATMRCVREKIKWLMSEYKPEPVLTEREKHFVELIREGWIARDENGELWWYDAKPKKREHRWNTGRQAYRFNKWIFDFEQCFRFITWEGEEPWAVSDLRKLKVGDQDA